MDGDSIAQLVYLSLLIAVIGGYILIAARQNIGRSLQQGAIWVFIFVGAVSVAGLWGDIRNTVAPRQTVIQDNGSSIISTPRAPDGHYYLTLQINDVPVRFVVDTGATDLVLTQSDAARAGLNVDELAFLGRANTANGETRTAAVRLAEVQLGDITEQNVRAIVNSGEMHDSLLGMAYLQHFGRIEIANNELRLIR